MIGRRRSVMGVPRNARQPTRRSTGPLRHPAQTSADNAPVRLHHPHRQPLAIRSPTSVRSRPSVHPPSAHIKSRRYNHKPANPTCKSTTPSPQPPSTKLTNPNTTLPPTNIPTNQSTNQPIDHSSTHPCNHAPINSPTLPSIQPSLTNTHTHIQQQPNQSIHPPFLTDADSIPRQHNRSRTQTVSVIFRWDCS